MALETLNTITTEPEREGLVELFRTALKPLEQLPPGSYFVYGSTALDVRRGEPFYGAEKVRFEGLGKMRDIDVAVFEDSADWQTVVNSAGDIYARTDGRYCMDPHLIRCTGDLVEIKGNVFPRKWLTTETVCVDGCPIQVIEPIPAILIRLLHADPRVRDTRRILHEIDLLPNVYALNDKRIIFGLKNLVHSPNFPRVVTVGVAKLVMGILPIETQNAIRSAWKRKDTHLGTSPVRQAPEFM